MRHATSRYFHHLFAEDGAAGVCVLLAQADVILCGGSFSFDASPFPVPLVQIVLFPAPFLLVSAPFALRIVPPFTFGIVPSL